MIKICKFFSAISNGKGKILFFTLNQIKKINQQENPKDYNWNSHTSIAHYNGINGTEEDKWNKWEYDNEKKELKIDGGYNNKDDSKEVKKVIIDYLSKNNAIYCRKVYCKNSGDNNSGYRNSGDWNSGYRNSGDWNSGYRNSGYRNSGDNNSGYRNSGYRNSGNRNSGYRNSGDWNSGDNNSGDWNSGDSNSGYLNTNQPNLRIFNKQTKLKSYNNFPNYFNFELHTWVSVLNMSDKDKRKYYWYKTTEGYLKRLEYKEAWINSFNNADKEDVAKTLNIPNFNYKLFEEISGITKQMLDKKLK